MELTDCAVRSEEVEHRGPQGLTRNDRERDRGEGREPRRSRREPETEIVQRYELCVSVTLGTAVIFTPDVRTRVGRGVGRTVGRAVGAGVAVAFATGLAVRVGAGVLVGVGDGVGEGVGVGDGVGERIGAATACGSFPTGGWSGASGLYG